ncbi:MAG: hypothetical protein KA297_19670 [Kofleriaceae bacterium]|jgi:hypothetical protein|nr:hypothetical protein [Kofleriaceae bacterium]MBP6839915.1 hypothetical protein [Kofleriaceae bacterium]MBP9896807.1 hypothetical protein [Gemmatimonadales bacterium]
MNRSSASALLLALAAASALGAGCSDSACEKLYAKLSKCDEDLKDVSKDEFVKQCEKARSSAKAKDEVAAMESCLSQKTCEEFNACGKKARAAASAKKRVVEIEKNLADGKIKDAWDDCSLMGDYLVDPTYLAACTKVFASVDKLTGDDLKNARSRCQYADDELKKVPEFTTVCAGLVGSALKDAIAAGTKARDAGTRDFGLCLEMQELVKSGGGDGAAVEMLCKEMDEAENAKAAVTEARANAAAKKLDTPYQCRSLPEALDKIGSEWAKTTRTEVLKACYVELGLVILTSDTSDAKYVCPYKISEVQKAAATHGLAEAYPELGAALAKLPKTCLKK